MKKALALFILFVSLFPICLNSQDMGTTNSKSLDTQNSIDNFSVRYLLGLILEPQFNPSQGSTTTKNGKNQLNPYFNFGADFVIPLVKSPRIYLEPSAQITTYTVKMSSINTAIISDQSVSEASVFGLLINVPVIFSFQLSDKFNLYTGIGTAFNFRFAIPNSSTASGSINTLYSYYFGMGRFFMPSAVFGGEYKIIQTGMLGFKIRYFAPISNLWTGEGLDFLSGTLFSLDISFRYFL